MKKLIILSLLNIFTQCQSQKKITLMTDKWFERFDVSRFNKNSSDKTYLITSNTGIILQDDQSPGYRERSYKASSYFKVYKFFYNNGNIEKKGLLFNEGSQIGVWYYFDESGKLIKEENTDEGYDFKPEDVIKYCEIHKIKLPKGYQDSGYQTSVQKRELDGKKVWAISYSTTVEREDFIEEIILDGKTGKLIRKKQTPYINN
ncbi:MULTISPECIES: hypothetical protein [unclassified Chryseobacterium]|uniref:hypothetical protein n=1 Tax=unclassified Chryseobacterium TaxID=2593645 RepID=UPI00226A01B7|nr:MULTISPECIES: hypothetical protein [unclassified Chryseobacterium]